MRLTFLYEQVAAEMKRLDPAPSAWWIEIAIGPDKLKPEKNYPPVYRIVFGYYDNNNPHTKDLRKRQERANVGGFNSPKELIMWVKLTVDRMVLDDSKNIDLE